MNCFFSLGVKLGWMDSEKLQLGENRSTKGYSVEKGVHFDWEIKETINQKLRYHNKPKSTHSKNNQTTGSEGKRELTNGMIV